MVEFDPSLPDVVPPSGKTGARHADDRNALVAALQKLGGGQTEIALRQVDGAESLLRFLDVADHARWTVGKNADEHFQVRRYHDDGTYAGSPIFIDRGSGLTYLSQIVVSSPSGATTPLIVQGSANPTESYLIVLDSTAAMRMRLKADGCLEVAAPGPGNALIVSNADIPVFAVREDGATKVGPAINESDAVQKAQVKAIAAASTDFADFQARMAAW